MNKKDDYELLELVYFPIIYELLSNKECCHDARMELINETIDDMNNEIPMNINKEHSIPMKLKTIRNYVLNNNDFNITKKVNLLSILNPMRKK